MGSQLLAAAKRNVRGEKLSLEDGREGKGTPRGVPRLLSSAPRAQPPVVCEHAGRLLWPGDPGTGWTMGSFLVDGV